MKLYNRNMPTNERIEYMGWVNEGVLNNNQPWQNYKPRFMALKGTDVMFFDTPPVRRERARDAGRVLAILRAAEISGDAEYRRRQGNGLHRRERTSSRGRASEGRPRPRGK